MLLWDWRKSRKVKVKLRFQGKEEGCRMPLNDLESCTIQLYRLSDEKGQVLSRAQRPHRVPRTTVLLHETVVEDIRMVP